MNGVKPLIYTACDTQYFLDHGEAFYRSCLEQKHDCVITVTPPVDKETPKEFFDYFKEFKTKFPDSHIDLLTGVYDVKIKDPRAYYASLRFIRLPEIYVRQKYILVMDIDSVMLNPVMLDEQYDLGLYLRLNNEDGGNDYEKNGMKVAAGLVYVTPNAENFVLDVANYLRTMHLKWFVDQHALFTAYQKYAKHKNILDFSETDILDWDFREGTNIWTGKGKRKFEDIYLQKKHQFMDAK